MTTLENSTLRVSIAPKGAQLTSLVHKDSGIEHLWQADPAVWGWHAPNLFPVVGGCLNNQILIDGQAYPMERHGFARQSAFTLIESSASRAVFELTDSDATHPHYPYAFSFQIGYQLQANRLSVTYRVSNNDTRPLYFSVGAHPAFAVPFLPDETYSDYFLVFEKAEPLQTHLLSAAGFFTGETAPIATDGQQLPLTMHLFDRDALVFKNLQSRQVAIRSHRHQHAVTLSFPDFPYLGIWAKPGAPFVCIEPWLGCADSEGQPRPFDQKEAIQRLETDQLVEHTFTIDVA